MKEKENETCYSYALENESIFPLKLFFWVSYRLFGIGLHTILTGLHTILNGATYYFFRINRFEGHLLMFCAKNQENAAESGM